MTVKLGRIITQYAENLPIAKSFDRGQSERTAQADQVDTFHNSHKISFRVMGHINENRQTWIVL